MGEYTYIRAIFAFIVDIIQIAGVLYYLQGEFHMGEWVVDVYSLRRTSKDDNIQETRRT